MVGDLQPIRAVAGILGGVGGTPPGQNELVAHLRRLVTDVDGTHRSDRPVELQ